MGGDQTSSKRTTGPLHVFGANFFEDVLARPGGATKGSVKTREVPVPVVEQTPERENEEPAEVVEEPVVVEEPRQVEQEPVAPATSSKQKKPAQQKKPAPEPVPTPV